ncbi:FecR domain-containing protein [Spirochaetota bacterium]
MKKHLLNKDFHRLLLHDNPEEEKLYSHIAECEHCKKEYQSLAKILKPVDYNQLNPSNKLQERILNSCNEIRNEDKIFKLKDKKTGFLKPAVYAMSSIAAIFLVAIIIKTYYPADKIEKHITFSHVEGNVFLNKLQAKPHFNITEKSIIHTGEKGKALISLTDVFKIHIFEKTDLEIIEYRYLKKKKSYEFKFRIARGTILSAFINKKKNVQYAFYTDHADILPVGTEFLLHASDKMTSVILTKGKIRIKNNHNNKIIFAQKNKKYVISKLTKIEKIDNSDRALIKEASIDSQNRIQNIAPKKSSLNKKNENKQKNKVDEIKDNKNKDTSTRGMIKKERKEMKKELRDTKKELRKSFRFRKGRNRK